MKSSRNVSIPLRVLATGDYVYTTAASKCFNSLTGISLARAWDTDYPYLVGFNSLTGISVVVASHTPDTEVGVSIPLRVLAIGKSRHRLVWLACVSIPLRVLAHRHEVS